MVQKVKNSLYANEMDDICKMMLENLKKIHTDAPDNVFAKVDSLEHHLHIPYNSKDFYIGVGEELVKYVTDHSASPQVQQVHHNITLICSLLKKVSEGLVELVLRQRGEEITAIADLKVDAMFILAGASAVRICKVVAVPFETTTRSGPQKGLTLSGWNDKTKDWTTLPQTQFVLQTVIMGKQCLVYIAGTSLRLLHLTEDQKMLVNDAAWQAKQRIHKANIAQSLRDLPIQKFTQSQVNEIELTLQKIHSMNQIGE